MSENTDKRIPLTTYIIMQIAINLILVVMIWYIYAQLIYLRNVYNPRHPVVGFFGLIFPILALTMDVKNEEKIPKIIGSISALFFVVTAVVFLCLASILDTTIERTWISFLTDIAWKLFVILFAGLGFQVVKGKL